MDGKTKGLAQGLAQGMAVNEAADVGQIHIGTPIGQIMKVGPAYKPPLQIREAKGGFIISWHDAVGSYREAVVTSVNKMLPILKEAFKDEG